MESTPGNRPPGDTPAAAPRAEAGPLPPPFRPPQPLQSRRRRHLVLLGATALTLAFAGSPYWVLLFADWGALLDPRVLFRAIQAGAPYALLTLLIVGAHEMGHYLACRYYRIPATLPFFIPGLPPLGTFGAVIRIRGIIPHRKALFDVAAAGPLAGLAVALPVYIAGWLLAEPFVHPPGEQIFALGKPVLRILIESTLPGTVMLEANALMRAGWVGMLVTSLNLFPVGQLDGGHLAYAISRRLHRWLARATILVLFLSLPAAALALREVPAYSLWFLILLWMRDRHPRLRNESAPVGTVRTWIAFLLLLIFLLSFIPLPLSMSGP